MKVLLPLLSFVLLLSVTVSQTGANKNVDMSDQRETREVPEDSLGEENHYDHREVTPAEASREEYFFLQHLDEEDLEESRVDGYLNSRRRLNEQAAQQKFKSVAENRASRNLVEASGREVNPPSKLGSMKTYICDNKVGMYRTVWLNLGETAFLHSPSFFQRREYPNNSNCGWKFETPAYQLLSFSCSVLDIREGDYLSLRDGSSEVQRFSGGRKLNYTTKMNSAFVVFYSNENESGRGFNCTVTSVRKRGTEDDRHDEVKPSVSEFEISSVQSIDSEYAADLARNARISVMSTHYTVSPHIGTISVGLVSETIEASTDIGSQTDRYDSSMTKSKSENVGQGKSSATEGRLNYMKLETKNSSMIAGVHSSKVLQTVVDARGYPSVATRTLLNSTRVIGSTTDVVEKREDGGGAEFSGIYTYDPSHSPGHTTTSVQESNMSSETNEKAEFVRDDRTGEKHQLSTSSTKKSETESTEIQSSKIDFPDDFVEPTPPM